MAQCAGTFCLEMENPPSSVLAPSEKHSQTSSERQLLLLYYPLFIQEIFYQPWRCYGDIAAIL
jgi:hypothetical protein